MNNTKAKIVAHRGESFDAPENSLSSINLAWEKGVKLVEVDIHLTLDNQIVVIHDTHTGRVGDSKHIIKKAKLIELKVVDIGVKKAKKFLGERIPTLNEVLQTVPPDGKLIIEIKCGEEIVQPLMKLMGNIKLRNEQIEFIAFRVEVVAKIKERLPYHNALWLLDLDYYWPHWILKINAHKIIKKIEEYNLNGADVWAGKVINKSFIKVFKEKGLLLYTWTVNDVGLAKELLNMNVDVITTDKAAWLTKQLMVQLQ